MQQSDATEVGIERVAALQSAVMVGRDPRLLWALSLAVALGAVALSVWLLGKLRMRSYDDETSPRNRRNQPMRVTTKRTGLKYVVLGNGFLGGHVVEALLARGETDVTAFDVEERPIFAGDARVTMIRGDVRDLDAVRAAVRGAHTVINTVARIALLTSQEDYQLSHSINCKGVQTVVEACAAEGVKILLHASTAEVVKSRGVDFTGPEDAPYASDPFGNYSKTKIIGEQAVIAANGRNGMRTAAMRFNSIWGPRDNYFVTRAATSTVLLSAASPHTMRDWCYVENCVHAFLKCEERMLQSSPSPCDGRAFFVADGRPMSVAKWYDMAGKAFGVPVCVIPMPIINLAGRVTDLMLWMSPLCNTGETCSTGLEVMDEVIHCSGNEARKAFGYSELYSIEDGLNASLRFHESIKQSIKKAKAQ
eukprot:m51a1_g14707 putative 3beta-hydroxysteroid dehydrogenase (421) ;mRNA; f:149662-151228